jgi:hypothetical protein
MTGSRDGGNSRLAKDGDSGAVRGKRPADDDLTAGDDSGFFLFLVPAVEAAEAVRGRVPRRDSAAVVVEAETVRFRARLDSAVEEVKVETARDRAPRLDSTAVVIAETVQDRV